MAAARGYVGVEGAPRCLHPLFFFRHTFSLPREKSGPEEEEGDYKRPSWPPDQAALCPFPPFGSRGMVGDLLQGEDGGTNDARQGFELSNFLVLQTVFDHGSLSPRMIAPSPGESPPSQRRRTTAGGLGGGRRMQTLGGNTAGIFVLCLFTVACILPLVSPRMISVWPSNLCH